jgi:hypothetical protein
MTIEEIRARLDAALPIRFPVRDPNQPSRQRIEGIEDYIAMTAQHRGELEEALHWCVEVEKNLDRAWDEVEGWETALPRRQDRTREKVAYEKKRISPELWDSKVEARTLKESIARQIRRLELDYDAASRTYTLMTGG